jgi:hypothetical protein
MFKWKENNQKNKVLRLLIIKNLYVSYWKHNVKHRNTKTNNY